MDISIIISTRNRAESLVKTLDSFQAVQVPEGAAAEILVVDNASNDNTREVAQRRKVGNFSLRYLSEPHPGKMWAQNLGLAEAQGTVLLTTDDDVRPCPQWLEHMVRPIFKGQWDAVAGRIELAPDLVRPWMTGMHKHWLASSEDKEGWPVVLVGASMAFHREVLKRVPAFDVELGPGALGLADDTLFSWQLEEAGYRIGQAEEATVRHHFDASRLSNASWMKAARDLGRSEAYLLHHWFHRSLRWPGLQRLVLTAKLRARRRLQRPLPDGEGAARWEMSYVFHIEKCRQFDVERKRLRNYDKRGLVKRQDGVVS